MNTGTQASEGIGISALTSGRKKFSTGRKRAIRMPSGMPTATARPKPNSTRYSVIGGVLEHGAVGSMPIRACRRPSAASAAAPAGNSRCARAPHRQRRRRGQRDGARAVSERVRSAVRGHERHHPPAHDGVVLEPLEHELLQREADDADHGDAGQHHIGVEELARAEDHPAEPPRHGGQHLDADQDAPGLRQAEPQPGEDVGQRAGQDHLANRRRSSAPIACAERTQISFTAFTPVQVLKMIGNAETKPTSSTAEILPSPNHSRNSGA